MPWDKLRRDRDDRIVNNHRRQKAIEMEQQKLKQQELQDIFNTTQSKAKEYFKAG